MLDRSGEGLGIQVKAWTSIMGARLSANSWASGKPRASPLSLKRTWGFLELALQQEPQAEETNVQHRKAVPAGDQRCSRSGAPMPPGRASQGKPKLLSYKSFRRNRSRERTMQLEFETKRLSFSSAKKLKGAQPTCRERPYGKGVSPGLTPVDARGTSVR